MAKLTLTALKVNLETKTKSQLIDEIAELYKALPEVKEYYQAQTDDVTEVLEKYKRIIQDEFADDMMRGLPKARLSVARKALSDFKKVSKNIELITELRLTFIESVSAFHHNFAPDVENLYESPENLMFDTLNDLEKAKLLDKFEPRIRKIVQNSTDAWGHYDTMSEHYEDFYGEL